MEDKAPAASSVLRLQGDYDGASWWVGGCATVRGGAGAAADLELHGLLLSRAVVGPDDRVTFFSNRPLLPVGYSHGWTVRVSRPGLAGEAAVELGIGPDLAMKGRPELDCRDPAAWDRHMAARRRVCAVPVGVVSQTWTPPRLSERDRALGANNVFCLMDDEDAFMRWSH